jgi:hypothetical protein
MRAGARDGGVEPINSIFDPRFTLGTLLRSLCQTFAQAPWQLQLPGRLSER